MLGLWIVTGMVYEWIYHFKKNENQNNWKHLTFLCGLLGVPTLVAEVCWKKPQPIGRCQHVQNLSQTCEPIIFSKGCFDGSSNWYRWLSDHVFHWSSGLLSSNWWLVWSLWHPITFLLDLFPPWSAYLVPLRAKRISIPGLSQNLSTEIPWNLQNPNNSRNVPSGNLT